MFFFSRYFLRFVAAVVQTLSITKPEWVLVRGRMVPNQRQSRIQSSCAFWYFTIEYWQEVCHSLFIVKKYQACVLRLEPPWFLGKWPLTKKPEASECEFEPTEKMFLLVEWLLLANLIWQAKKKTDTANAYWESKRITLTKILIKSFIILFLTKLEYYFRHCLLWNSQKIQICWR